MLPYSRSTNYTDDSVPAISAQDLNDMQDGVADLTRAAHGEDFSISDHFTGAAVDASKWVSFVSGVGTVTIVDEADANGSLKLHATGGDGDGNITTRLLNTLHFLDFRAIARVRAASLGGASSDIRFDIRTGLNFVGFSYGTFPGANWIISLEGGNHDSGVAVTPATYQILEMRRTNGVFEFLIDGDVKYTETLAFDMTASYMELLGNRQTSGTTTVYADYVKMRQRQ